MVYVEPSRRPADARYGENPPHRVYQHHQLQVILKPSPDNVQDTYLDSLKEIGVDPLKHDIRFVEDNWEAPTLGAWGGLGWEVWLDGMEITQFTYFQQVGSINCELESAELTYGLERIAMYLQDVDNIFDIKWNENITYGDIFKQAEYEHSVYSFEKANIETLRNLFDIYEEEAINNIEEGLVLPSYDYVLKCSHTFNVLDARGALSVTERTHYISRVRSLAKMVASKYIAQRESLGYPLLKEGGVVEMNNKYLLEIGVEELPARFIGNALAQLENNMKNLLKEQRIEYESIETYATPRRLVLIIEGLGDKQETIEEKIKGPAKGIAYDEKGNPTKALQGFMRGQGIDIDQISFQDYNGEEYVYANVVKKRENDRGSIVKKIWPI